jgi:RNA polymerase sigma-70 factor (ECF subfamily)
MSHNHAHTQDNCADLLAQLNAYVDDELQAELCRDLERHLAGCTDCQTVIDTLAHTINLYRTLGSTPEQLPEDVEVRLVRRLCAKPPCDT